MLSAIMALEQTRYSFERFTEAHLDLVNDWLTAPEVSRWYRDPEYIEDLEDQLEDKNISMRLACFDGKPFAFVQDYDIHAWPDHHLAYLKPGGRGVDTFIGDTRMIGGGHGPKYLKLLIEELRTAGAPQIGIDPHPDNQRAIKAYTKLGFKRDREVASEWGRVLLMSLDFP